MKRVLLFLIFICQTFLINAIDLPDKFTVVELNTPTLKVGNRDLRINDTFKGDAVVYWQSKSQAAVVQDNTGQLYIFTKEAFEQKNVKTPKEYLMTGKISTRPPFGSPTIGIDKSHFPEKRVAMVIGNSNYESRADFLRAPIADAVMISNKLLSLGFDTYTIFDATSSDLFKSVAKFSEISSNYDIALFYYSGHGFCYNHENYYQPVDISNIDAATIHSCLKASDLMHDLSQKASKGTILIMDACRSLAKVRGEYTFAPMEALPGMMIFCSTSDGKAAIDAIGEYSPFAKAFADNIFIEGSPLYLVARNIMNAVRKTTSELQSPSISDHIYDDFYFCPPKVSGNKSKSISDTEITIPSANSSNTHIVKVDTKRYDQPQYVDLGLSVLWASCNIGGKNPEEYGDYFSWGEIESKNVYDWTTYKWCKDSEKNLTKYNYSSTSGTIDGLWRITLEDDVANVKFGGDWRLPTKAEFDELKKNCTWERISLNGVRGYKASSKINGYTDKWIFLPAAGYYSGNEFHGGKELYYYVSSDLDYLDPKDCYIFYTYSDITGGPSTGRENRKNGFSVRPVKGSYDVHVKSISLNYTSLLAEQGMSVRLHYKILPSTATNTNVIWKSSDPRIVIVDYLGEVKAISCGTAVITATTQDGQFTSSCSITVSEPSIIEEYVDLGLSVKWASCNIGASKPEEYGGFYQWAGTNNVSDKSINLNYNNCPYHSGTDNYTGWSKYIPSYGTAWWAGTGNPDNRRRLAAQDDIANITLGGDWHIPSLNEWKELIQDCEWLPIKLKGVDGYKITSKKDGYMHKWIFLPSAGCRYDQCHYNNAIGYYWSSSLRLDYPDDAIATVFSPNNIGTDNEHRYYGCSIRPVSK